MEKISVTVITYNEHKNIRRCLESVKWADEIVVVDSNSSDGTADIARSLGARVIVNKWPGHIAQKNYAIDCATHRWILSLDADEELSAPLQAEILSLRKNGFRVRGYRLPRKVYYLGKWIRHSGWYPDYKLRLFDREFGRWGGIDPHDIIVLQGPYDTLHGDLLHYSYENIAAHIQRVNSYTSIAAGELLKSGRKPHFYQIIINPVVKFFKTYFIKRGILDGKAGFFISVIGSFYVFLKYLKFWECYFLSGTTKMERP